MKEGQKCRGEGGRTVCCCSIGLGRRSNESEPFECEVRGGRVEGEGEAFDGKGRGFFGDEDGLGGSGWSEGREEGGVGARGGEGC